MYGKTALSNLMETRCEHCGSRFRVTDQQLQRALGQVRCSECGKVFNAMYNLQSLAQEDMPGPIESIELSSAAGGGQAEQIEPVVDTSSISELSLHEAMYGSEKRSMWSISPLFVFIGILLLLALGTMQTVYYLRYQLVQDARFQQQVITLCRILPCDPALFASTRQIKLLERNVFTHPSSNNALMINGAFINQASFSQKLPNMLVSLFDIQGKLIANRVFTPAEYLRDGQNQTTIAPQTPVQFLLEVVDPGTDALTYEFEFI